MCGWGWRWKIGDGLAGESTQFPYQKLPPGRGEEVGGELRELGCPLPRPQCGRQGRALTSTLVMSQSLTALLWTPLVTIWKPLAVAVCSSTEDGWGGQPKPWGFPGPSRPPCGPHAPDGRGSVQAQLYAEATPWPGAQRGDWARGRARRPERELLRPLPSPRLAGRCDSQGLPPVPPTTSRGTRCQAGLFRGVSWTTSASPFSTAPAPAPSSWTSPVHGARETCVLLSPRTLLPHPDGLQHDGDAECPQQVGQTNPTDAHRLHKPPRG